MTIKKLKDSRYNYNIYFYPEIKDQITAEELKSIEEKLSDDIKSDMSLFISLRRVGENEDYLCELIRQDSIEEFIPYINREIISPSAKIKESIFETNSFLIENEPTLIEYAAFYGSVKIFQYLKHQVELTPNIWFYSIHSNNAEMIQFIESNNIEPPGTNYEKCLKESIKCHHNNIAEYILNNLIEEDKDKQQFDPENDFKNNIFAYCYEYYNYHFLTKGSNHKYELHYACEFGHYQLVDLYFKQGNIDVVSPCILKIIFFNIIKTI